MANIYAASGMYEDEEKIEVTTVKKVKKGNYFSSS